MLVIDDVLYKAEHVAMDLADRMIEHRRTLNTTSLIDRKLLALFEAHLTISEDRAASLARVRETYKHLHPAGLRLVRSR